MTTTETEPRSLGSVPALNAQTLGLTFIADFFATMAFDVWGQVVSPGIGFANLSPHGLAKSRLAQRESHLENCAFAFA